ncbi:CLUMA_CG010298, isoform A [Clunio marinus]|uniref:CLUMA_CG010298, isoform A n=1 Tax=Clunio marinus TaxID=568069 RepID=A0A1J1I9P5_9DIPT|nr:CLUMA_CG010298, isoform A [Clunio marinus]
MLKNFSTIINRLTHQVRGRNSCRTITSSFFGDTAVGPLYEPPYLEAMKPPYPSYDVVNFRITGYDFPILESYQRFVHKIAEQLDLDVSDCWAHPPKKEQIVRYRPSSTVVDAQYDLTTYERYVQISDLQAPIYPIFLRFIQSGLPEGVTLSVVHQTDIIEESRYVPDKDLIELKAQLDAAGGPILSRRR